jgi:hypothetical protein
VDKTETTFDVEQLQLDQSFYRGSYRRHFLSGCQVRLLRRRYRVGEAFLAEYELASDNQLPSGAIERRQRTDALSYGCAELPPLAYWGSIYADTGNFPRIALPRHRGLRGR